MRFRILTIAFCFAALSITVVDALGQFADVAAKVPNPTEPPPQPDELVRQLESTATRGGVFRAQSINSLARIGAWPQVDRWVSQMDAVADQAVLAESAEVIGTDLLLRISLRSDLSDASRSAIKKMTDAANANHQSPDRLQTAIRQLAEQNVDANLDANRTLLAGGNAAIAEIVAAIAKGQPAQQRNKLLGVLRALGDGGAQSLNQLSLYGDPSVRSAALDALRILDPAYARDTLISSAFALDAIGDEARIAGGWAAIPSDFNKLDAIAVLAARLKTLRGVAFRTPNDLSPATLWSVDENRTGVRSDRSTEVFLRYRDAYDAAQRLRRLGDLPPSVARSVLAADLSYRVMVDVDWGDPAQLKEIDESYGGLLETPFLLAALAEQRRAEEIPAAVALVRLISNSIKVGGQSSDVLLGSEGDFSGLVDAVRDPQARIRYEAATCVSELVSSLGNGFSFPGSSYVRKTLAEMTRLDSRPTVILIETRPIVALRQEAILGQLGFGVRKVTSAIDAEREIQRGGDLRMVISKIRIADAVPAELVDRVRRQPTGRRIPIVFYSDAETSEKSVQRTELETTSNRWISDNTPAVYLVPLPGSPAALADVLVEVESKRRLPALSIGDRAMFRNIGVDALQGDSLPH